MFEFRSKEICKTHKCLRLSTFDPLWYIPSQYRALLWVKTMQRISGHSDLIHVSYMGSLSWRHGSYSVDTDSVQNMATNVPCSYCRSGSGLESRQLQVRSSGDCGLSYTPSMQIDRCGLYAFMHLQAGKRVLHGRQVKVIRYMNALDQHCSIQLRSMCIHPAA